MEILKFFLICVMTSSGCMTTWAVNPWTWVCRDEICTKADREHLLETERGTSLKICKLNCGPYGSLWPKPTLKTSIGNTLVPFRTENVIFPSTNDPKLDRKIKDLETTLKEYLFMAKSSEEKNFAIMNSTISKPKGTEKYSVFVKLFIINPEVEQFTLAHTSEHYSLNVIKYDEKNLVEVNITALNYFGARHGVETLSQLMEYDIEEKTFKMVADVSIEDEPQYAYRGILLDTSRNFISVDGLIRLIDGMSYNKMNMFHWHIVDSHSFPMVSKSVPKMSQYGAYTPAQIYTVEDMRKVVAHGLKKGVKTVIEFDAPAHAGNGWQWSTKEGKGDMAVCINKEPWDHFCVEPPCGQLNPINEEMYKTLGLIYGDILDIFDNDLIHMGGDEVDFNCWNSTLEIKKYMIEHKSLDEDSYIELWADFQTRALNLLKEQTKSEKLKAILWTSHLVSEKHVLKYINKDDYIIQIWAEGTDKVIPFLIDNGYQVILSNYDKLYLDCGYGAWVGNSLNNWCSPYKGWQQIYDNDLYAIYKASSSKEAADSAKAENLLLGSEAALWTEQADEQSFESKIWPRLSALAERLWSNPKTTWHVAETRMVQNRDRMVSRGISPDSLQPQWCLQNEGKCFS